MPKFAMPPGFEMPDNAVPGEPFEVVATVVVEDDGSVMVTAIDGAPIEGYEDKPEGEAPAQEAPQEPDFLGGVAAAMSA